MYEVRNAKYKVGSAMNGQPGTITIANKQNTKHERKIRASFFFEKYKYWRC